MISSKIKKITEIVFWTVFIFVTKHIMVFSGSNNLVDYALIGPALFMLGAHTASVGAPKLAASAGFFGGWARKKAREEWRTDHAKMDAEDSSKQLDRWKSMYSNLSMSNPYLNMENTMEDLTINQKQVQFQRQALQQSQKNLLNTVRQSAGGSGVSSLAQALARQDERASQQMVADVSQQQVKNRQLALQQRDRMQRLEREARLIPAQFRAQQVGSIMGMTQKQYAFDKDLEQQYHATTMNQTSARISSNLSAFNTMLGGMT